MKVLNRYFFLFLILFSGKLVSQTIKGKIIEAGTNNFVPASIIFKSTDNNNSEFIISKDGSYSKVLKNNYDELVIEINALNYAPQIFTINNPVKNKIYTVDFQLKKEQAKEIKEVIVPSKKKSFEVKKDTISYNVSSYRDGTERKIEEIIKKLPGVELNPNTGEIKYKGKSIETVQIDGDDLFGSNYSIGTKNINVNIVDQIQAIENYSANPLLKGIENGDKVALNIKLKKGKIDLSGDINYESGFAEDKTQMHNINANIIQISNKYKSFGTFGYNNIGINNTSFDYFSFRPNVEQVKENMFLAKKAIPETIFTDFFNDGRANINNTVFNNYNNIFKVSKKLQIKLNLYQLSDKLNFTQSLRTENFINGNNFTTKDFYEIKKRPSLYRGDIELKINTSKSSLLQYNIKYYKENITTDSDITLNEENKYKTSLSSRSSIFKQNLLYTYKISDNKALQTELYQSFNEIPQNFISVPDIKLNQNLSFSTQFSKFIKSIIGGRIILLGNRSKSNDKYAFAIGGEITKAPLESYIITNEELKDFTNNIDYNKGSLYTSGSYHLYVGNFKFSPSYNLSLITQRLNSENKKNSFVIEPELMFSYKLNDISKLISTTNYKQQTFSEENFFTEPIFINNRTSINNIPSIEIQKIFSTQAFYSLLNLYKQFQLNFGVIYSLNKGNYFSKINITELNTDYTYFYLPQNNENLSFSLMADKYIPFLKSKLKLKSYYSIFKYKNIVNDIQLKDNVSTSANVEFSLKTAFNLKINFENILSYDYLSTKKEEDARNNNVSIRNTFIIIYKPASEWLLMSYLDYINPNIHNSKKNLFLDIMLNKHINTNLSVEVNAKNILNSRSIARVLTSDYNIEYLNTNLIPRYFSFGINYKF
ncbi:hypothetical protein [Chryseobacterium luteum]|uniref:hypothetical protein n=1 Tax=Chryseobacterium luteum TaxID=421531 RepID=UPI00054D2931|nr:hypothetical protein [Chryseobacterium luteum]